MNITAQQVRPNATDYQNRVRLIVAKAASTGTAQVQAAAAAGRMLTLYLYYKPGAQAREGELLLVPDEEQAPDGFLLATGEGLRCDVPYAAYFAWIHQRSKSLPILSWE